MLGFGLKATWLAFLVMGAPALMMLSAVGFRVPCTDHLPP
jgi:hypothetical protein